MPRRLVLLRHAKSAWPDELADHQRPLAGRGRREAPLAGRWLAARVPDIDLVVCSSAVRTRQTWDLVAAELSGEPELRIEDRVYEASASGLLDLVRHLPDGVHTVLVVGHNPGLEDLVGLLTGDWSRMLTSTIAVLAVDGDWTGLDEGGATLETIEVARG